MKFSATLIAGILLLAGKPRVFSQGFVNLNFESADVAGYSPGNFIPIAMALPGWNAALLNSSGTNPVTQIAYDGASTGGSFISIIDTNISYSGFYPPVGKYSVWLFGGGSSVFYSAQISQTGLVPAGTESLLIDADYEMAPFIVMLGGQVINMIPLQTFSKYTLYGGNISSFAGQVETLSFTEPPAPDVQPSFLKLDYIQFSSSAVPEPGIYSLSAFGGLILGWCRWQKKRQ